MTDDYWTDFVQESEEQITELNNSLLVLERAPDDDEAIDGIFRIAHTLKGNCGAMGLTRASDLAHALEDLLDGVRTGAVDVSPALMDTVFDGVDQLEAMIAEVEESGEIRTDPAETIARIRARADAATDEASRRLSAPTDQEIDAVLARFDPPENPDHEAFLARLEIADGDGTNDGARVVEALIDAFDLLGTDPSREAIDNGEYGSRFDAVFASAVGEAAIAAALEPVDAVAAFEIVAVTDRLASAASDRSFVPEDPAKDLSAEEAQELSVDDLLGEFEEFDDLDAMVEESETDDLDVFDEMGDAGSFDDLFAERPLAEEPERAAGASDGASADADDGDVDDAGAVFAELKSEVEMVGFDELQDELDALEFDEFDSDDEIGMDELLGDDVDVSDDSFLDVGDDLLEEPADDAPENDDPAAERDAPDSEEESLEGAEESLEEDETETTDVTVSFEAEDEPSASGEFGESTTAFEATESADADVFDDFGESTDEVVEFGADAAGEPFDDGSDELESFGDDSGELESFDDGNDRLEPFDDDEFDGADGFDDAAVDPFADPVDGDEPSALEAAASIDFEDEGTGFDESPGNDSASDDRIAAESPPMEIPEIPVPAAPERTAAGRESDQLQSVRVDVEQIDSLLTLVEGLVTSRVRLRHAIEAGEDRQTIGRELDDLADLTSSLQETVMDVRLVPVRTVANRLPRVVRDIAREQGKEVSFELSGEDVELDRSILDRIGDPLIHLVRNAVDHGIEPPDDREAAGKPAEGAVEVRTERTRDRVRIVVEDDGRGLDPDRLRSAAVDAGVLAKSEAEARADAEVYDLIFHPGLSTAAEVTDVSGRGVGMDVVERTIEDLEGTVSVDSDPGAGTTVTMTVPVTVAIADVLFLECGDTEFGIPVKAVRDIEPASAIETVDGCEVLSTEEADLPVVSLADVLETPAADTDGEGMVIRIRDGVRPVALRCDRVSGQQEVVVKPFEGFLGGVPGLSGATVRGRGEVVNILDVTTL